MSDLKSIGQQVSEQMKANTALFASPLTKLAKAMQARHNE